MAPDSSSDLQLMLQWQVVSFGCHGQLCDAITLFFSSLASLEHFCDANLASTFLSSTLKKYFILSIYKR